MKNIHIIKTDKPSRLYLTKEGLYFLLPNIKGNDVKFQHIYITSDEEIKEGDWYINNGHLLKCTEVKKRSSCRKIILTTDHELIKDGVQAIDDEFLEWFVKNSNCKEVEIKLVQFEIDLGLGDSCIEYGSYYKIIIPQEEPIILDEAKQRAKNYMSLKGALKPKCTCKEHDPYCCQVHGTCPTCVKKEEPKQETLEEAADKWVFETNGHKWSNNNNEAGDNFGSFKAGAKWQQEKILEFLYLEITERRDYSASKMCEKVIEFIEQFKK